MTRALWPTAPTTEQRLRARLDEARSRVQEVELARARLESEAAALSRERARIADERAAASARADEARRRAGRGPACRRTVVRRGGARGSGASACSSASREVEELRAAGHADQEHLSGVRVARERLSADAERTARRAAESERRRDEQARAAADAGNVAAATASSAESAAEARSAAHEAEVAAEAEATAARLALGEAEASAAAGRDGSGSRGCRSSRPGGPRDDAAPTAGGRARSIICCARCAPAAAVASRTGSKSSQTCGWPWRLRSVMPWRASCSMPPMRAVLGDAAAVLVLRDTTRGQVRDRAVAWIARWPASTRASSRLAAAGWPAPCDSIPTATPLGCWHAAPGCPTSRPRWRCATVCRRAGAS